MLTCLMQARFGRVSFTYCQKIMSQEVCLTVYFFLLLLTPAQLRTCTRALDVVFALDSGMDIPDDDWSLMTRLSRDVAYHLYPSTDGSHVAHVQFAGNTSVVHGLNTELVTTDRPEPLQTGRNLSDAISTIRRLVLNNMDGDRPEVPDVIVLITHGLSDNKDGAIAEASRVKSDGIRIITVGMTRTEVDKLREELQQIATDPDDVENLILINRNHYSATFSALLRTTCKNRVEANNENTIRLVDGTSHTGRLEAYIQEEWVTVCSNSWSALNTRIACKQLGFPDGLSMFTMNQTFYHRRIGIANIQCIGHETNLLQCPHDPFFRIDSSCDHQRDVFLRCLCGDCNDYIPNPRVRLINETAISGRLEVFSPTGWGGVCRTGWTASNTRVVCRQLGFRDGAGIYQRIHTQSAIFMFNVSCFGFETSLFDCAYSTTSTEQCSDLIYIRCECNHCPELLLQEPRQKDAMAQSIEVFEWTFKHNISTFEIVFLSQKNPQTLIYIEQGKVVKECTRFKHRIQLMNDYNGTVGFNLTNITSTDMGVYSLYARKPKLNSITILIVNDFAKIPDPQVHRQVHDGVELSWNMTPLRKLRDTNQEVHLTTPATGRLRLNYYHTQWLRDNPLRHRVSQSTDDLHPTVIIDNVNVKDAGNYVIELTLTSSVYPWLNACWQFATELVVTSKPDFIPTHRPDCFLTSELVVINTDYSHPHLTRNPIYASETTNTLLLALTVVFGVLFGLAVIVIVTLIRACRKLNRAIEVRTTTRSGPTTYDTGYLGISLTSSPTAETAQIGDGYLNIFDKGSQAVTRAYPYPQTVTEDFRKRQTDLADPGCQMNVIVHQEFDGNRHNDQLEPVDDDFEITNIDE